jgi:hypothetical protein
MSNLFLPFLTMKYLSCLTVECGVFSAPKDWTLFILLVYCVNFRSFDKGSVTYS